MLVVVCVSLLCVRRQPVRSACLGAAPLADVARERAEPRNRRDDLVGNAGGARDLAARLGGRLGERRDAEQREGGHGDRQLSRAEHRSESPAAQAHVGLDAAQVGREAAVRHARRALDHPRAVPVSTRGAS
jgi:hypothetical protein